MENQPSPDAAPNGNSSQGSNRTNSLMAFMSEKKIAVLMWAVRIYALYLSLHFLLLGSVYYSAQNFQKAMIANAVVCALRLHQRIPDFRFNREHFARILEEDSAHYLLFSFIFMMTSPFTVALMPVGIFALLHICSFTRQLLDAGRYNISPLLRLLNFVAKHQTMLFRIVALNEAMAFPFLIGMVLSGGAPLFAPILYYKFLQCRYLSLRNPYSKYIFYELRVSFDYLSRHPRCPAFVSSLIVKAINLVCRMAPQPLAASTNQQ